MGKVNKVWNRNMRSTTDGLRVIEDDREYVGGVLRRAPKYDPWRGSSREYIWTDDAACNGSDPEAFQMSQTGDPGAEELRNQALTKYNREKLEYARKTCVSCPVKKRCLEEASPSDRYWSVRGGLMPTRMTSEGPRDAPAFDMKPWEPPFECKKHGSMNIAERTQTNRHGKTYTYKYCEACNRAVSSR